jgi:6-phosphogluconolactonase
MKRSCKIYETPQDLAEAFAIELISRIKKAKKDNSTLTIAISGGSTPKLLLSVLAEKYKTAVDWGMVKLFWVDERCVPPDDAESNFGMTDKILLSKVLIPAGNIFRIRGEDDPVKEASRYSAVITGNTGNKNNIPYFDIVILGMGDDGHTASIFPGNDKLLYNNSICETAVHPVSGQWRITITGKVINNAKAIFILVTGEKKSDIVRRIFSNSEDTKIFPAGHINSVEGITSWLLDKDAGQFIL